MTAIYAIGDVHGQLGMLKDALERIEADGGPDARVVLLGDLVDRGPDSRGVIELLSRGIAEGRDWHVLLGNHDRMFRRFLDSGSVHDGRISSGMGWLHPALGGPATLASYGVALRDGMAVDAVQAAARAVVPNSHRALLARLRPIHREPGLIFVHAGLRPGVPLEAQDEDDLIWIRDEFHEVRTPWEALVVHGHTPVEVPTHYGNRVNLDTGAGYGRPLSVGVFEAGEVFVLDDTGRVALG